MSGGVLITPAGVEATPDDLPGADSDGSHRHIAMFERLASFIEGEAHEVVITIEREISHVIHFSLVKLLRIVTCSLW